MKTAAKFLALLIVAAWFSSCGSGSYGGNGGGTTNKGYLLGQRLGADVYMQPSPPAYTFPSWSGTAPNIRIDEVTQFSSTVNPVGTNIYQTTTQVIFGQVTGPTAGKEVIAYSYTNAYYIQPLTSTTININGDSTWIAPANAGQITALLVAQGYAAPDTTTTLPAIDGVNVFAVATAGVNSSQFTFTEYPIPTAASGLFAIAAGPDSALWFAEGNANKIGRITTSGTLTEYPVPTAGAAPNDIVAGPDGALWFTESSANKIGRIATSGAVTEYPVPTAAAYPSVIAAGPDGALWFTEYNANRIGRITTSGAVTEYPVPTPGSGPSSIATGPDGALWFTEIYGYKIGRITTSGEFTEYPIPNSLGYIPSPYQITNGPDGALWFDEAPSGVGRITTAGTITEYYDSYTAIAAGPDGMMWYIGFNGSSGVLGQFSASGQISSYDIPPPNSSGVQGFSITTGPDSALWFTDYTLNLVGRFGPI
jgi:virginiamycin B lyase